MTSFDKPDSLDSAIDATVRDMMQVDPRSGLRQRVAGSIGARRTRSFTFRFGLPALAAVMVLLVSVLLLRRSDPAPPDHAPQVAETTPAAPADPRAGPPTAGPQAAGPQTAGPQTAGPRTAERSAGRAAPAPRASTTASATPVVARRRSSPTPESIFGGRSDRVAAASLRAVSAGEAGSEVLEMAPEFQTWPGFFGITPLRLEPIQVIPITIQPLTLNNLRR